IKSDNATFRSNGIFVNQLQYTMMASSGDSGSLIWDQNSLTVVGLHKSHDNTYCYGNKILRVIELLTRAFTSYDIKGSPTHFQRVEISLLDLRDVQGGQSSSKVSRDVPRSALD